MPLYVCRRWKGVVTSLEGQELQWVRPVEAPRLPMPPADKPLMSHLILLLWADTRVQKEADVEEMALRPMMALCARALPPTRQGATAIEYALIASEVGAAVAATVYNLGSATQALYSHLVLDVLIRGQRTDDGRRITLLLFPYRLSCVI